MNYAEKEWQELRSCINDDQAKDGRSCFLSGMLCGIAMMAKEHQGKTRLDEVEATALYISDELKTNRTG